MEISTKANGKKIKSMEKEFILSKMALSGQEGMRMGNRYDQNCG